MNKQSKDGIIRLKKEAIEQCRDCQKSQSKKIHGNILHHIDTKK